MGYIFKVGLNEPGRIGDSWGWRSECSVAAKRDVLTCWNETTCLKYVDRMSLDRRNVTQASSSTDIIKTLLWGPFYFNCFVSCFLFFFFLFFVTLINGRPRQGHSIIDQQPITISSQQRSTNLKPDFRNKNLTMYFQLLSASVEPFRLCITRLKNNSPCWSTHSSHMRFINLRFSFYLGFLNSFHEKQQL
jgi:hypothetical protein